MIRTLFQKLSMRVRMYRCYKRSRVFRVCYSVKHHNLPITPNLFLYVRPVQVSHEFGERFGAENFLIETTPAQSSRSNPVLELVNPCCSFAGYEPSDFDDYEGGDNVPA